MYNERIYSIMHESFKDVLEYAHQEGMDKFYVIDCDAGVSLDLGPVIGEDGEGLYQEWNSDLVALYAISNNPYVKVVWHQYVGYDTLVILIKQMH